ncbi:MAG: DUF5908 family protein [Pseudomonadota bacterium]
MPIIVDEVVISVEVTPAQGGGGTASATHDKQALIAECVEQVLEILRNRQER